MPNRILAVILIVVALESIGTAQSRNALVRTWKLVSASETTDKGDVREAPFGRDPTGLLTYTADGRIMAIIADGGRKPLSSSHWDSPVYERAQAFSTFIAYAGRYTFAGDKVTHHVEAASMQNWVNTDATRLIVNFQGDRVTLGTTEPFVRDGLRYIYEELVWERMK